MAENSAISWTDDTFNPWVGCQKVHPGCANCYAERDFGIRKGFAEWGPRGTRVRTSKANWAKPRQWNAAACDSGARRRVFIASLCDVFEDWRGPILNSSGAVLCKQLGDLGTICGQITMDDVRRDLFDIFDPLDHLEKLFLTKRPGKVLDMLDRINRVRLPRKSMLGTSICDQQTADAMVDDLIRCKSVCDGLFLSIEPMLGPIDLSPWINHLSWIICGGESGNGFRVIEDAWAIGVRDQCVAAGVPFFFKQRSGLRPGNNFELDGKVWHEIPPVL